MFYFLLFFFPVLCMAAQWPNPPDTISTPGINASSPSIAIDSNGNAVAVWIENNYVVSSNKPFKQSWTSPLASLSGSGASQPQVVVDLNGRATAIWLQNGDVNTASQPANGVWSSATTLSGASASTPQISLDTSGNIVVVWEEGGVIQSSTQLINGSWSVTPDTLSPANASLPAVSIGSTGTVGVVWQQSDNSIHTISKPISGSWGTAQQISSSGVNSAYPQVTVNGQGTTVAAWFTFDVSNGQYSNVVVQAALQEAGGAWKMPTNLSAPGFLNPSRLQLAVGSGVSDDAIACWTNSYGGSLFNVEYSPLINGAWAESVALAYNNLLAYSVSLGTGFQDSAYMVYMCNASGAVIQGFLSELTILEHGGMLWTLSTGGENAYPNTAVNINGSTPYGVTAWTNNGGSYNAIQALATKFPVLQPPSQFSATQQSTNYGLFSQYNNLLEWTASSSPQTVGYVLLRNGIEIAIFTVMTPTYQYIDYNQLTTDTIQYSIYAFDSYGYVSGLVNATPGP